MSNLLSINLLGVEGIAKAVKEISDFEKHRGTFNFLAYGIMQGQVRRTFDKQADPVSGVAWKPVQPFGHGTDPSHKILQSNAGAGLMGSITSAPMKVEGDMVSIAPSDSIPYANVHQYGGEIRPRLARNLAIPMGRQERLSGGARRWWHQQTQKGLKPFVYSAWTGKGNKFIAMVDPETKKLKLHWLLKEKVFMPQRRYFGWNSEYEAEIEKAFAGRLQAIVRRALADADKGNR